MYVCICNAITSKMIKDDPSIILKVGTNCGKCIEEAGQKVASKKIHGQANTTCHSYRPD